MNRYLILNLALAICAVIFLNGCGQPSTNEKEISRVKRSLENKLGTHFEDISHVHFKAPKVSSIDLFESFPGSIVLGATGRDDKGNIYIGASANEGAHLYQYDPINNKLSLQGNVIEQLKNAGLYKAGMSQSTMHSKIFMADDGYLYFSSLDKLTSISDEKEEHTSYLWRKKPTDTDWEHVLSSREALVAINTDGRYVYALGTPDHVLYQFDTLHKRAAKVIVGSVGDHFSRNFLVSTSGNIFVPRLQKLPNEEIAVDLMEYDNALHLVDTHPMKYYHNPKKFSQHGITSYTNIKNGDMYFVTAQGALYHLRPKNNVNHELRFVSYLDDSEQAGSYVSSLFSPDGKAYIVGMGNKPNNVNYSWFIHEVNNGITVTYDIPNLTTRTSLYGSVTRDNQGSFYVGGMDNIDPNTQKLTVLKLSYNQ